MTQNDLYTFLLRMADHSMILGQRMAEWCSHAHILEEDIALANISLDHFGQADAFYKYAAEVEGKGRTHDDLAFLRQEREYVNLLICEQPNGHFGRTIARSFYYDLYHLLVLQELSKSSDERLAGIAAKGVKEAKYHVMHSCQWVLRLGDGTEESHAKMQESLDHMFQFTHEFWEMDEVDQAVFDAGVGVDFSSIEATWTEKVTEVIDQATLTFPDVPYRQTGSKKGIHTEHLGKMLGEMQYLQRAFPGATWE